MVSQDILVTVAIPVHNAAPFLGAALNSVLAQTHPRLEVLLYDDGSTDGTLELARSFTDPRLQIITAAGNSGVGVARQKLKCTARGDYIAWLDADDIYAPQRVEVLLQAALAEGADLVIDSSGYIDDSGEPMPGEKKVPYRVAVDPHFTRLFERNRMNPHPLVSRACFEEIDFDPELKVSEDYDFWLKASLAGYQFHRVDRVLHHYRLTSGSLSSDPRPAHRSVLKIFNKYRVEDLKRLYRKRCFGEDQVRYMACLQHLFRQEYSEALAHVIGPWPGEENEDQDFYRGTLALKCGLERDAGLYLRRHLERFPDSPAGHNNFGVMRQRRGAEAGEHWRRALHLFPGYHDALANIGGVESLTMTQLAPGRHR